MSARPDDRTPAAGETTETVIESARRATLRSGEPLVQPPLPRAADGPSPMLEADRYTEREMIARGGSSIVIRAFDNDILRDVAVKILDPELASDGSQVDRFAEEARITGQLEHPNIVPVYELGHDRAGRRFLSMKLVQGETLQDTLVRLGSVRLDPPRLAELLQVFLKVCDAVAFAHSRDVIHRDLKPTNIMISDFGQVYVLDWGIARLRPAHASQQGPRVRVSAGRVEQSELDPPGSLVGTACYMAPEQLHGKHHELDERTDVFALGATLYQILAGQPPLTPEIIRAIWTRKTPPAITPPELLVSGARLPAELSQIAMRAIAYEPAERYRSVADLKRDIESFQRGAWDLPRVAMSAGSTIITEGERGESAYVILEGRCVAYRVEGSTEIELRVMGPGDVFGETAVFSRKPRSASVRATTDMVLLRVTGDVLSKALGLHSWMGAFVRALADRFRESDLRLRALERLSGPPDPQPLSGRYPYDGEGDRASSVAEPLSDAPAPSSPAPSLPRILLPSGSVIIAEGDSGDAGYVILEGRCTEYRVEGTTEIVVRELAAGDVFGETSVLTGYASAVGVKAMTDVALIVVKRAVLSNALGLNSWMGAFVKALAVR
ncbi:MAG: cyclic nucleotide-binding domain-containing protein, partial [Myxococcota bacterium]|nr:cyclic nucleotide-binding domain-containing protein [Myxococcota bacterium]